MASTNGLNKVLVVLREKEGVTTKEMASIIGKSTSSLRNYEQGKSNIPEEVLSKLSKYFGYTLEQLRNGSLEKKVQEEAPQTEEVEAAAPQTEETAVALEEAATPEEAEAEKPVEKAPEKPVQRKPKMGPTYDAPVQILIQSRMGGEIPVDKVIAMILDVCPTAEKIYVKPEDNRAYWTKGTASGSVILWE